MFATDESAGAQQADAPQRVARVLAGDRILDLGQHRRQDEARRLRDLLAEYVVDSLEKDERLPSDEQVARQFHCSRNAARIALQMLADERLIDRTVGVGTYVMTDPSRWRTDHLVDSLVVRGGGALRWERLVGWRVTTTIPAAMRAEFDPEAERLAIFERVFSYNGKPGSLRTYHVPLRGNDVFEPADANGDIFEVLEGRFGHAGLRASRTISAIAADASAAEVLEVQVGTPLLLIETIVRAPAGDIVLSYSGRQRTDVVRIGLEPERVAVIGEGS
ncbi:GntR family transcriptional regulator [Salinibacterium sp. dk2585]|uniref:UTRA domain-containing protein n=1 Tax=unclassified Salinibacterium TaxID=2632331 RepID=UPI0011C250F7|nr:MULTISPECIES: GntR family transcriptional regulator [unclassified Salinibacterium]QEE60580.1 GntR family transcriptional regulator [Salinibacterium sp. dk2585]TXK55652.1 GntR family transcriptional regulator [Salinibacterium sp. dk5596]